MEATLIFLVPQIIYSGKFSEREAESIVLEGRDKATDWLENNIDYSSRVRAHAENARLRDEVIKLEMQIASMNVEGAAAAQGSDRRGGGGAGHGICRLCRLQRWHVFKSAGLFYVPCVPLRKDFPNKKLVGE